MNRNSGSQVFYKNENNLDLKANWKTFKIFKKRKELLFYNGLTHQIRTYVRTYVCVLEGKKC